MKDYIINYPQLQSFQKRIASMFIWAICWLMWIYLLTPLITLCVWLFGDNAMNNEMRWFGGYKSLLELLQIYVVTLMVLAMLWLCWVIFHFQRKPIHFPKAGKVVEDGDICAFYQVKSEELQISRNSRINTVFFDDQGHIVQLEPKITL